MSALEKTIMFRIYQIPTSFIHPLIQKAVIDHHGVSGTMLTKMAPSITKLSSAMTEVTALRLNAMSSGSKLWAFSPWGWAIDWMGQVPWSCSSIPFDYMLCFWKLLFHFHVVFIFYLFKEDLRWSL